MDRADQSVTRHAAASRAAYETLYTAFASQPAGIKESHRGVLQSLRGELRIDQSFANEVAARYTAKKRGGKVGQPGLGSLGDEKFGTDTEEQPAIQIAWKEVLHITAVKIYLLTFGNVSGPASLAFYPSFHDQHLPLLPLPPGLVRLLRPGLYDGDI